jgi:hypothetical protein
LIGEEIELLENSSRSLVVIRGFIIKCNMVVRIAVAVVSAPAVLHLLDIIPCRKHDILTFE